MKNNLYHTPVLLQVAIDALQIEDGEKYIDGTLGGGGHCEAILKKGGIVLGIDRDLDAVNECKKRFLGNKNITIAHGNFKDIKKLAIDNEFINCSGILLDLGTSVHQLKNSGRGFSICRHEVLDMRMDEREQLSARDIVNKWSKRQLQEIFEKFGEESASGIIAEQIINKRKNQEIIYSDELAAIISKIKKREGPGSHPATKIFQALRIVVNDELGVIKSTLWDGVNLLNKDGRIVVISFHSLEDRIVKQTFLELERLGIGKVVTKKPIRATYDEIKENRKARSAKMRVFEKQ